MDAPSKSYALRATLLHSRRRSGRNMTKAFVVKPLLNHPLIAAVDRHLGAGGVGEQRPGQGGRQGGHVL